MPLSSDSRYAISSRALAIAALKFNMRAARSAVASAARDLRQRRRELRAPRDRCLAHFPPEPGRASSPVAGLSTSVREKSTQIGSQQNTSAERSSG